jgi:hypothetical protein
MTGVICCNILQQSGPKKDGKPFDKGIKPVAQHKRNVLQHETAYLVTFQSKEASAMATVGVTKRNSYLSLCI